MSPRHSVMNSGNAKRASCASSLIWTFRAEKLTDTPPIKLYSLLCDTRQNNQPNPAPYLPLYPNKQRKMHYISVYFQVRLVQRKRLIEYFAAFFFFLFARYRPKIYLANALCNWLSLKADLLQLTPCVKRRSPCRQTDSISALRVPPLLYMNTQ